VLTDLRVRNLGVIDDLTVRFGPGMTALTGETGAGKTLLVEALQLVLGGRPAPGLVRAGAEEAMVEARFESGGTEVVLARSVPAAGRSRAWVDGRMVPVAALAEAGAALVDIHGQHDHQSLLSATAQRRALDEFAGADLEPRRLARRRLAEIDRALAELGGDEQARAREADVLRHQAAEIEGAAIADVEEEAALRAEEDRLADLAAHREMAALALALLDGARGTAGDTTAEPATDLLGRAAAALGGRPAFGQWESRLRGALAEVADVASDLRVVVETWEDDPGRLATVQARRRLLADLRQKYGADLAEVAAFAERARTRLEILEQAAERADALDAERRAAEAAVSAAEEVLGRVRRQAAPALAGAVGARLADLAMAGARFDVSVGEGAPGDRVQFLLGANPGEPLQPLERVASGGELARAMLALRLVATGGPETMVFDEVDAGVGGAAARSLARALGEAADGRQVLVVTHLAQVAAHADAQVAVEKRVEGGRTVTAAVQLDRDRRVVEVSRMLSGHPDSDTARAHAEELLGRAAGRAVPAASTTDDRRVD
jgi:DNA repair protein RecN (Recombination protein N)